MSQVELRSNEYNCKNCGAILHFDPQSQGLKCDDCNSVFLLEYKKTFVKKPITTVEPTDTKRDEWVKDNKVFKCNNCGASVVANKLDISNVCPYCGTNLIIQLNSIPGLKPDAIVPFAFDEDNAAVKFVENVKRKFYVSGAFKKRLPTQKIHGTYIPSFAFDSITTSTYKGVLTKTEHHDKYTTTTRIPISGTLNKTYVNVLVESSTKMTQSELNGILPFDIKKSVDYQNAYILGYTVEHYADTLAVCQKTEQQIISSLIRKDILSKYYYSGVESLNIQTNYLDTSYNYMLVPVYKFEYTYKNKPFTTYMNGQTGKLDNNLPKSIPKIVMTVVVCLLIILLPFILSYLN